MHFLNEATFSSFFELHTTHSILGFHPKYIIKLKNFTTYIFFNVLKERTHILTLSYNLERHLGFGVRIENRILPIRFFFIDLAKRY